MAIQSNRQTQQTAPIMPSGYPAVSTKCILAGRVYIKAVDASPTAATNIAPMAGKLGDVALSAWTGPGTTGWSDLGAVMKSKVSMTYTKNYTDVRSGLDGVYKLSYVNSKSCEWSFALDNFDIYVLDKLLGSNITDSSYSAYVTSAGDVGYRLWVGKEDIVSSQLLMIGSNKIDSKEHQYWCPDADLSFAWEDDGDAVVIRCTAKLKASRMVQDTKAANSELDSFYQVTIWE